ncbi:hypothetical protein ACUH90_07645 [Dermabacteraceae bacterium P7054]
MNVLLGIFVSLHLLCWAITLGAWAVAVKTRKPSPAIAHAAGGALVFGILAMIVAMSLGPISGSGHLFYTIKLLFALITTGAAFVAKSRQEETPNLVWYAIPAAIVANVFVGVFQLGM